MQIEMNIKGLMIDPITNMPIIILRDQEGQRILPIWVGVFEANAIALQIENVQTPRPMTHDLLKNIIDDLSAQVERIVVTELKENTFYALIHLRRNGHSIEVDARPSDAIALALRTRSPIFVEEAVIQNARSVENSRESSMDVTRLQKWLEGPVRGRARQVQDVAFPARAGPLRTPPPTTLQLAVPGLMAPTFGLDRGKRLCLRSRWFRCFPPSSFPRLVALESRLGNANGGIR